ncbi:endolytic transglycosylase MltG [Catenuloplanes atrovinosus]|uniref:Endolytic murein transglycosylase n=1 Tax=Catenuloplanes atrovinosus TaxID=137266 RepID=A0AAE3YRD7_9ACTN|nr:endolytic transglycosylase MltG [Catenuloplanes atrovinosus]MDR7277053.1 UPF0755 protein [Catenuloplanes atrovinosus]
MVDERQPRKGRPLHRRGGTRGTRIVALVTAILVIGGLAGAGYLARDRFITPDYDGPGQGEAMVEVKAGASATAIGSALHEKDVVKSVKAFVVAANANPDSTAIQVGFYRVKKQMRAADALRMLLDLENRVSTKVTIPEGTTSFDVFKALAEATEIPVEDFRDAAKDPVALGVPEFWFTRGDGRTTEKSIEGFLYPDTYHFDPGLDAAQLLGVMVRRFLDVTAEIDFVAKVEDRPEDLTPYDALMIASLCQSEAGIAEDFPRVARVIYNTMFEPGEEIGYRPVLRLDVTINYGLMLRGKAPKPSGTLTVPELRDATNPWNTHLNEGLPPSPITNPGKAALQAAESPADGDWYFFVAIDGTGRSAFAATHAEHELNQDRARANGAL